MSVGTDARPETITRAGREMTVRTRSISLRIDIRSVLVSVALLAAIVVIGIWSITIGDFPLTVGEVWRSLTGTGDAGADFVVRELRLPRVLTGTMVGIALGMSGAALQSLVRNPLGSPDIIGFDRGAALGAVLAITAFSAPGIGVAIGAVAGGLVAAVIVYLLAWRRGVRSYRLVLVGIGLGFTASAVVDYVLTRADIDRVQQATIWLTGSLNGRSWDQVRLLAVGLLVLAPAVAVTKRTLDRLALGDDIAVALGVSLDRARLGVVLVAVALAGLAVAAAGPIAFVAFVAGPIARRLADTPGAALLPAGLTGALVTISGDLAARTLVQPVELPVGIATSIVGAPYLLWVLARQIKEGDL